MAKSFVVSALRRPGGSEAQNSSCEARAGKSVNHVQGLTLRKSGIRETGL